MPKPAAARTALLVWLTMMLFTAGAVAQADAQRIDTEASKLFNKVMSPFCPGRMIANCPSPQAQELQAAIKDKLRAGESPDAIEQELYATYGDDIRAVPQARGFNLLAWGVPGFFFVVGAVVLARWMRPRWPSTAPAGRSVPLLAAEVEARLENELSEIDSLT
jgi:cytochrome c-type biogenesis protein CcmH/NrfF